MKNAAPKTSALDFQQIAEDFRTLDPKDPGLWPLIPRLVILSGVFVVLVLVIWYFLWMPQLDELEAERTKENGLRQEWLDKKKQAINLDAQRAQLAEINRTFGALLKQLPNAAEVEKLLVDINQAGIGHGLQVDFFQPMGEQRKDFYAELPIKIQLRGTYHELGEFAGDIAALPRIVTLNDIEITVAKDATLSMNAIAKTFRYLDEGEIAAMKKSTQKGPKK